MKKCYNIDISNDPLFEEQSIKKIGRQQRQNKEIRFKTVPSEDITKVYDALNFSEDIPKTAKNKTNSLLKYIKRQEHDVQLIKNSRNQTDISNNDSFMWLGDLQETHIYDDLPNIEVFLEGRTREMIIRTSQENKRRISNIMLKLEDNQRELVSRHKTYVREQKFSSYNKEIQDQELEYYITLGKNDNPNLNMKLINSKINQSGRNSTVQPIRQPFKSINLQQVKEKIVFDMLRKDANCKQDPLRLQFFNLYRIMMQNRTIKSNKEQEVMELLNKSESQRKETIKEKRQLLNPNRMRFTFMEKDSQRLLMNKSLDERMNKNQFQRKQFKKLLEYLKIHQLEITQENKEHLEIIKQKLLSQQIISLNNLRYIPKSQFYDLIVQFLKI